MVFKASIKLNAIYLLPTGLDTWFTIELISIYVIIYSGVSY